MLSQLFTLEMVARATNCSYISAITRLNINYFFAAAITHTAQNICIFSSAEAVHDKYKTALQRLIQIL